MITLSHVSDVTDVKDAHKRVAYAVRSSCLPISLTTLCHVIPFCVGIASHYYVTKLVSIYFGRSLRQILCASFDWSPKESQSTKHNYVHACRLKLKIHHHLSFINPWHMAYATQMLQ